MARLVATRAEPKCVVCRSPQREAADRWIAQLGETDGTGRKVTWNRLAEEVMPLLLGRASIGTSSLRRHRSSHCRLVDDEAADASDTPDWENDSETQAVIAEIRELALRDHVPPSALLNLQQRLWLLTAKRKLESGERIEITADQAARAADKLMQGEKTHEQTELLNLLGQGISRVFTKALGSHDDEPAELDAAEVVAIEEAEVEGEAR